MTLPREAIELGPGKFVLSLDTEIAWGTFDHGGLGRYASHFNNIRGIVRRLVNLLEQYEIPATWAFVGHLLLESCEKGADGTTHPDVLRPLYSWYPHDWHNCDPGTDVERDPWWYGPDLFAMVVDASVQHEVATHTFSHIVVDDPACTTEIFRSQLDACVKLHRERGHAIDSIVYPRNRVAYLQELSRAGISVYRGREERWYDVLHPRLVKALGMVDRSFSFTPRTYRIDTASVPVNVPASMFYASRDGFRKLIPIASRVRQARRGILRAAERGELFHLWFHPFNLGSDPALFDGLEKILSLAAEMRASNKLLTLTMAQAAGVVDRPGTHT